MMNPHQWISWKQVLNLIRTAFDGDQALPASLILYHLAYRPVGIEGLVAVTQAANAPFRDTIANEIVGVIQNVSSEDSVVQVYRTLALQIRCYSMERL